MCKRKNCVRQGPQDLEERVIRCYSAVLTHECVKGQSWKDSEVLRHFRIPSSVGMTLAQIRPKRQS